MGERGGGEMGGVEGRRGGWEEERGREKQDEEDHVSGILEMVDS